MVLKTLKDLELVYAVGIAEQKACWKMVGVQAQEGVKLPSCNSHGSAAMEMTSLVFEEIVPYKTYQQSVEMTFCGIPDQYLPEICFSWYTRDHGHAIVQTKYEKTGHETWRFSSCYTPQREGEQVRLLNLAIPQGIHGVREILIKNYNLVQLLC